jgi:hypothetical protein
MKSTALIVYVILLFGAPFVANAQSNDDLPKSVPSSIRFSFKLPSTLANKSFKNLVSGIVDFNINYQTPLFKNIIGGIGGKYNYYEADNLKTAGQSNGKLQVFTGFGKLGYQQFLTPRIFWDAGLKGGYAVIFAQNDLCSEFSEGQARTTQTSLFIEPTAGLYMVSEDNLAFGLVMSYSIMQNNFHPSLLCMDNSTNLFNPVDTEGAYQLINIGFGASLFIGKNRLKKTSQGY